jgi:hypothetical protein
MTMTTPPDARMATEWRRAIERGELPMITIYERPDEFPDEYVAQLWLMRRGVGELAFQALQLDDQDTSSANDVPLSRRRVVDTAHVADRLIDQVLEPPDPTASAIAAGDQLMAIADRGPLPGMALTRPSVVGLHGRPPSGSSHPLRVFSFEWPIRIARSLRRPITGIRSMRTFGFPLSPFLNRYARGGLP